MHKKRGCAQDRARVDRRFRSLEKLRESRVCVLGFGSSRTRCSFSLSPTFPLPNDSTSGTKPITCISTNSPTRETRNDGYDWTTARVSIGFGFDSRDTRPVSSRSLLLGLLLFEVPATGERSVNRQVIIVEGRRGKLTRRHGFGPWEGAWCTWRERGSGSARARQRERGQEKRFVPVGVPENESSTHSDREVGEELDDHGNTQNVSLDFWDSTVATGRRTT